MLISLDRIMLLASGPYPEDLLLAIYPIYALVALMFVGVTLIGSAPFPHAKWMTVSGSFLGAVWLGMNGMVAIPLGAFLGALAGCLVTYFVWPVYLFHRKG